MAFTTEQRKGLVDKIVVNGTFGEDDRDSLNKLTDNQLVALLDSAKLDMVVNKAKGMDLSSVDDEMIRNEYKSRFGKKVKDDEEMTDNMDDEEDMEDDDEEEEEVPSKMSANQWMARAPREVREMIANARRIEQSRRQGLIEQIVANGACPLNEAELSHRSTEDLELFAQMATPSFDSGFNYTGAAGSVVTNSRKSIEPLSVPSAAYMD